MHFINFVAKVFSAKFLFLVLIRLEISAGVESEAKVAEVGEEITLTCLTSSTAVSWEFEQDEKFKSVPHSGVFDIITSGSEHNLTFTVGEPNQYEIKWRCSDWNTGDIIKTWDLKVYVKPESFACGPPYFYYDSPRVTCRAEKIYPKGWCYGRLFEISLGRDYYSYEYDKNTLNKTNGYYETECVLYTYLYRVGDEGNYRFEVTVIPDTNPQCTDCGVVALSSVVKLESAKLELQNCPVENSYLKTDSIYSCDCVIISPGNPPVEYVYWRTYYWLNREQIISKVGGNPASMNFTATYDAIFECRPENSFYSGFQRFLTLKPKVAFGPDSMSIDISQNDKATPSIIDFCTDDMDLTIKCSTLNTTVNPGNPYMRVLLNDDSLVDYKGSQYDGSDYFITHDYRLQGQGGRYSFKCQGQNTEYSDLMNETTHDILIQKPPSKPKFQVSGETINQIYTTDKEDTHKVKCFVTDGYPKLSKLNLNCGENKQEVRNSDSVSMDIELNKDSNGLTCRCVGEHVTGCYTQNSATFTVNFQYQPEIRSFTAKKENDEDRNRESDELTINEGDSVEFSCQLDGNPTPQVVISRDKSQTDRVIDNLWTRKMDCGDTDTYYCDAENGVRKPDSRQIQVFVKCPLQLKKTPSQKDLDVFEVPVNKTSHTVILDVVGYPTPNENKIILQANSMEVPKEKYVLNLHDFEPKKAEGNLIITFVDLKEEDFHSYELLAEFERKIVIVHTFNISVEEPTPANEEINADDEESSLVFILVVVFSNLASILIVLAICFILYRYCRHYRYCRPECLNKPNEEAEQGTKDFKEDENAKVFKEDENAYNQTDCYKDDVHIYEGLNYDECHMTTEAMRQLSIQRKTDTHLDNVNDDPNQENSKQKSKLAKKSDKRSENKQNNKDKHDYKNAKSISKPFDSIDNESNSSSRSNMSPFTIAKNLDYGNDTKKAETENYENWKQQNENTKNEHKNCTDEYDGYI